MPDTEFNPRSEQYKKVEDLPDEEQVNFSPVEGGFVRAEAAETQAKAEIEAGVRNQEKPWWAKFLRSSDDTALDVLHEQANDIEEAERGHQSDELLAKIYTHYLRNCESYRQQTLDSIDYYQRKNTQKLVLPDVVLVSHGGFEGLLKQLQREVKKTDAQIQECHRKLTAVEDRLRLQHAGA